MIGIYRIKNLVNGKCYYGSSKQIEKRFDRHKRGLKNKSDSKGYRESIKNQPIKVRSQPIIFKTQ